MNDFDMDKVGQGLVSDEEAQTIIRSFMENNGRGEAREGELRELIDWAHGVRTDGILLDLVLEGKVLITGVWEGEPIFKQAKLEEST